MPFEVDVDSFISVFRQKPKIPPTNKRFLQNTLLSTLPRKRKHTEEKNIAEKCTNFDSDDKSDEQFDEKIKPEVDEKITEFRKKHSKDYEDAKQRRQQAAEEKRNLRKARKQAEIEKKNFDNVMRYGVKVGAKKEKVVQGKKKAIFDRRRGIWMPLGKTYHAPGSDSSDEDRASTSHKHGDKKYEEYHGYHHHHQYPNHRGRGYYDNPRGRAREWHAYYVAMYSYYHYHKAHMDYNRASGGGHTSSEYRYEDDHDLRERAENSDRESSTDSESEYLERRRKESSSHRKHKKHKKVKKSKKKRKKSKKKRAVTRTDSDESEDTSEVERPRKRKRTKKETNDTEDSDSDSGPSEVQSDTN